MTTALLVALLGALGSLGRWLLAGAVQRLAGPLFPLGTFVVNGLGSFAIGLVMGLFAARGALEGPLRIALTAGLLGGFTTMSSFAFETWLLVERRAYLLAGLNLAGTLLVCVGAAAGGQGLVRALLLRS